jgi:hypothetical protein
MAKARHRKPQATAKRQYFSYSGEQLAALFEAHRRDEGVLAEIRAELGHRSTPSARALLERVTKQIDELRHGDSEDERPEDTRVEQGSLFPPEAPQIEEEPTGADESDERVDSPSGTASADPTLPPDDRRRPSKFTLMQRPGVRPRPAKFVPVLSRDLRLNVPRDASRARRFSAAVEALVEEMKAKGTGSRSFILSDGCATELGAEGFGYIFDFLEDADIFEDARVEVVLGGRRCAGTVVGLLPGKIILNLDADLGPRIRTCVLKIDNTALLMALKDRLDDLDSKKLNLNVTLADEVLAKEDLDDGSAVLHAPVQDGKLDGAQAQAVRRALQRRTFFLWGPPGTGKTHTLAALVGALFDAEKRVLICSNTNQAVDQLLVQLCRQLTPAHPALAGGRVLRQGHVDPERLGEFGEYLIVDRIVERLSRDLHRRREELQRKLDGLETAIAQLDQVLHRFEELDHAVEGESQLVAQAEQRRRDHDALKSQIDDARRQLVADEDAVRTWQQAGAIRRTFMASEERLKQAVETSKARVRAVEAKVQDAATARGRAESNLDQHRARIATLRRDLAPHDRERLAARRATFESDRAPLRNELADVQAKLADVERSLLANARVIGTTVTRSYLSAKELGAFDAVIVDEASMVILPALYLATGLARERVVISGDFNQLPPIVQSSQQAIIDAIGGDVFAAAGVGRNGRTDARMTMLDTQRRMVEQICALIREPMRYGKLKTDPSTTSRRWHSTPPAPFDGPLTVIDSSRLWPFENRNLLGSRFNLMHTLLVRNFCWHMRKSGYLREKKDLGVCTPYAAQAKLEAEILKDEGIGDLVVASTVHRFQGDERRMMLLDIPESIGSGPFVGRFIQADHPDDDGAKLLNVALSRTQEHLVVLGNLTYLDAKLPSNAMLRHYIYECQRHGRVVDAVDLLALRPIEADLEDIRRDAEVEWDESEWGLFRQDGFDSLFQSDVAKAKKSVAIFSGFVTPQRVAAYGDLLRRKVQQGVAVRCVTRPPWCNGTMSPDDSARALDALEAIGAVVDTRAVIHEKVVIIDDEIVWFGSLNPLSHTSRTDELMQRVVSKRWASKLATLLAVAPISGSDEQGVSARRENPPCSRCEGRMCYIGRGRWGPYFKCEAEACGHTQSVFRR